MKNLLTNYLNRLKMKYAFKWIEQASLSVVKIVGIGDDAYLFTNDGSYRKITIGHRLVLAELEELMKRG